MTTTSLFDQVLSNTQTHATDHHKAIEAVKSGILERPIVIRPQTEGSLFNRPFEGLRDYGILPVESSAISGPYGTIEGKKGLFCDSECINIVSDRYEIHQPSEILSQFKNVAAETGLEVKRVLFNKSNGGLLISSKINDCKIVGENHDLSLTFYTSHCGKYKTFLSLSALRIACFNQVPMLVRKKSNHLFAEKHYKNALNVQSLGKLLEKIPSLVDQHNAKAETMQSKIVKFSDFVELCREKWKAEAETRAWEKKMEKLRSAYYNAPGQDIIQNDSAYKAYQAITFLNTHDGRDTKYKEETVITKNAIECLEFEEILLEA